MLDEVVAEVEQVNVNPGAGRQLITANHREENASVTSRQQNP
jgi:hypothetical protein